MSVQSDCLMDDNVPGSEKKSEFRSLAASHLADLPKYIAVKLHRIATFFATPAIKTVYLLFKRGEDFEISTRALSLGTHSSPPHGQFIAPSLPQAAIYA